MQASHADSKLPSTQSLASRMAPHCLHCMTGLTDWVLHTQKIAVLSLGTGISIAPARVNQEYAGAGSWLLLDGPLLDVLTGGSQELSTALETTDMLAVIHLLLQRDVPAIEWQPHSCSDHELHQTAGAECRPVIAQVKQSQVHLHRFV